MIPLRPISCFYDPLLSQDSTRPSPKRRKSVRDPSAEGENAADRPKSLRHAANVARVQCAGRIHSRLEPEMLNWIQMRAVFWGEKWSDLGAWHYFAKPFGSMGAAHAVLPAVQRASCQTVPTRTSCTPTNSRETAAGRRTVWRSHAASWTTTPSNCRWKSSGRCWPARAARSRPSARQVVGRGQRHRVHPAHGLAFGVRVTGRTKGPHHWWFGRPSSRIGSPADNRSLRCPGRKTSFAFLVDAGLTFM